MAGLDGKSVLITGGGRGIGAAAFDINAKGVYHAMRAALPRMRAQGFGTVVTLSSGAATTPRVG